MRLGLRLLLSAAAIVAASHADASTITFAGSFAGRPSAADFTGSTLQNATAVDLDATSTIFGNVYGGITIGSRNPPAILPSTFTLSWAGGNVEKFDYLAGITRAPGSLDLTLVGSYFKNNVLQGPALLGLDFTQPGGYGNPVQVSYRDYADPVRVTPAPEVSTWVMLAMGFMGLASVGWWQKKTPRNI